MDQLNIAALIFSILFLAKVTMPLGAKLYRKPIMPTFELPPSSSCASYSIASCADLCQERRLRKTHTRYTIKRLMRRRLLRDAMHLV